MKILIVEDDPNMRKILKLYLEKEGYSVDAAADGEKALDYFEYHQADLVILDWMLPKKDGIEVCREIRSMQIPVKIIMLTAKTTSEHEIRGLMTGADDYMKKPFDIDVLLTRIKKLCHTEGALSFEDITLRPAGHEVTRGGERLDLTPKEYELLQYLMVNKNLLLTREQILSHVWGFDYMGDSRTVDTHIRRLRQKLGSDYIQTRFGSGYMMEEKHA